MDGYRRWIEAKQSEHPWTVGAVQAVVTAPMIALVVRPRGYIPVGFVMTVVLGILFFGYLYKSRAGGRPTDREIMIALGAIAGVMLIAMAIEAIPR